MFLKMAILTLTILTTLCSLWRGPAGRTIPYGFVVLIWLVILLSLTKGEYSTESVNFVKTKS